MTDKRVELVDWWRPGDVEMMFESHWATLQEADELAAGLIARGYEVSRGNCRRRGGADSGHTPQEILHRIDNGIPL